MNGLGDGLVGYTAGAAQDFRFPCRFGGQGSGVGEFQESGETFRTAGNPAEKEVLFGDDPEALAGDPFANAPEAPGVAFRFAPLSGCAKTQDRATRAKRVSGEADGCSEFHEGLVVFARVVRVEERFGSAGECSPRPGGIPHRGGVGVQAGEDPDDVAVDNRDGLPESETGDRSRRVGPNPWKAPPCGGGVRLGVGGAPGPCESV